MGTMSDFAARKYAMAALIAFVGLANIAEGVPEGVWLVAAGAIIAILVRAIQTSGRAQ
jgi:hypothetical protein